MSIKFEYLSDANLVIDRVYSSNGSANASGDVLSKLMHVAAFGGFRKRKCKSSNDIAYIVLESTQKQIDWIDEINIETGNVTYFGDNRTPGHELHDTSTTYLK